MKRKSKQDPLIIVWVWILIIFSIIFTVAWSKAFFGELFMDKEEVRYIPMEYRS